MNLESMVEHCEECGTKLEIGQIGLCGDCQSRNEFCDECGSELEDGQTGLCAACLRKSDVVADVTFSDGRHEQFAILRLNGLFCTHYPDAIASLSKAYQTEAEAHAALMGHIRAILAWQCLGNVPVNDDGNILAPFDMCTPRSNVQFPVGTSREKIWHMFEDAFDLGIVDHLQPMASAKIEVMPSSVTHQPKA